MGQNVSAPLKMTSRSSAHSRRRKRRRAKYQEGMFCQNGYMNQHNGREINHATSNGAGWWSGSKPRPGQNHRTASPSAGASRQTDAGNYAINYYRENLTRLVSLLETRLAAFDSQPDEYAPSLEIRELRLSLQKSLENYFAAVGSRDVTDIPEVTDIMNRVDVRLKSLDEEVQCEVARFEYSAAVLASRERPSVSADARRDLLADVNDLLIELIVYKTSWAPAIQLDVRKRLQNVQLMLRGMSDSLISEPWLPTPPPLAVTNGKERAPRDRSDSSASSFDGTYDGVLRREQTQSVSSPRSVAAQGHRLGLLRRSTKSNIRFPSNRGKIESHPSRLPVFQRSSSRNQGQILSVGGETASYAGGDEHNSSPARNLMRNRTLKDIAASMRSGSSHTFEDQKSVAWESTFSDSSTVIPAERTPASNEAPPPLRSFASILYATRTVSPEAVTDTGISFYQSPVRGDGRCLFRSVVRSRAVARGCSPPAEREERESADQLRVAVVKELKRHRELLTQFNVIEADFQKYTRRMANPRTHAGEPELLLLAKIIHCPIAVYMQLSGRFKQIQVYGRPYGGEPIRILYSDGIHYDALLVDAGGRSR